MLKATPDARSAVRLSSSRTPATATSRTTRRRLSRPRDDRHAPTPGGSPTPHCWPIGIGDAIPRFAAAGLAAEFIGRGDTQVYVASSADAVLVSFRGSEPDRLGDAFDDASFALTRWTTGAVPGFERALGRVSKELDAMIAPLANTRAVWFTGHSLGAALATLAADRFPAAAGVCTLGSPRVGDRAFAAAFDARFGARALRYVNDSDIVTHVPPPLPLPYAHVGELRQITPEGRVTQQPPALAHFVRDLFGDVGHLQEITNLLSAGSLRRPPHFLLDHMPRGYAVDIWNDFDAHGTLTS
jgi:triacylglycerol lipase